MHLKIKRGLNIPLLGQPSGVLQRLPSPETVALDLDPFYFLRFSLLKKIGDKVVIGEPLIQDKSYPGRVFVSPTSGTIKEIVRGLKRRILRLTIHSDHKPHFFDHGLFTSGSKKELLSYLMKGGLFPHISVRPCMRLPTLETLPDAIFVKAIASAPFAPPPELEVEGNEILFQKGLSTLSILSSVHLVYHAESTCLAFSNAVDVETHPAEGPHPISHPSLHIAAIHPITQNNQSVWSLTVTDVIAVGLLISEGKYYHERVISRAGEKILENKRGYFKAVCGFPIQELINGCLEDEKVRLISGDPLMGSKVTCDEYMKFFDSTVCALPHPQEKRRLCHFMRFGTKSYTSMPVYFKRKKNYSLTTLQHGEKRAFVDGVIYEQVMPLNVPVMHLIKAVLAEDFELAESLGLLSVHPEDFALPAFICPSKIEMPEIIRRGLHAYANHYLA